MLSTIFTLFFPNTFYSINAFIITCSHRITSILFHFNRIDFQPTTISTQCKNKCATTALLQSTKLYHFHRWPLLLHYSVFPLFETYNFYFPCRKCSHASARFFKFNFVICCWKCFCCCCCNYGDIRFLLLCRIFENDDICLPFTLH